MDSRPTGTVSFLFTDIAGSTRLWDEDPGSMAGSLAVHDLILQEAIADHGGYVFSTAGDSYAAAFPTASQAIAAAIQSQLGLASETWQGPPIRVRMGIHTGSSEERGGNFFGPHVNRAARVMSAANGGQVLVSGVTAELVMGAVAPPVSVVDRGTHALKDLDRPEHLFELLHPDLPIVEESLKTLNVIGSRLPVQLTTFIGRQAELELIDALVRESPLVTLTGVGGTGKTRLSIEMASGAQHRFRDGVWMVELAAVADPDLVINEVADVWGLRPGEGASLLQVLNAYLRNRELLLVVDNCEHVLGAVAALLSEILAASPGVTVLATSRESLGVPGEAVFRVPSMGLPAADAVAADSDAVRLFLDRAERARPGFDRSAPDTDAIVRICRRLDGIPLGIELAAARLRTLSESDLADRLDDSFRILTGGSKTAVPRQRTLQTAIDWSYDLLEPEESALFRRLAVFAGGFDLAAAEFVGDQADSETVLEVLDQLVDKSLVVALHGGAQSRFRMLEPIRQYGQERLDAEGEAEEAHLSHARYYAELVERVSVRLRGPEQKQANADLIAEIDNVRSALDTLVEVDVNAFFDTCFHLWWFWAQSSLQVEGRDTVLAGLGAAGERAVPATVAKGWWLASSLAVFLTDPAGVEYARRGLAAARSAGDDLLSGWLSVALGVAEATVGDDGRAGRWLTEGRRLIEAGGAGPIWDEAWDSGLLSLMLAFGGVGSKEEQRLNMVDAMRKADALGDNYLKTMAMMTSSDLFGTGRDEWVLSQLRESIDILRHLGFRHGLGHALFLFGARSQDLGTADALDELAEAASLLAEVGDVPCSTWSAARLVRGLLDRGRSGEARLRLMETAERLLAFERDVDSDLVVLACRTAIAVGELESAARFLGHVESRRPDDLGLGEYRSAVAAGVGDTRLATLVAEGTAGDRRVVLQWIRDV